MTTHSSILARIIPWINGGLHSMGLQIDTTEHTLTQYINKAEASTVVEH